MFKVYLVIFGGGYEAPSYKLETTEAAAWKQADAWAKDLEEGDWVDVLEFNLSNLAISRLEK